MILHSKITPERLQITPDHTRSSQNHAFVTLFLNVYFAALIIFSLLSSMNELIVAFEITVLFEHAQHIIHHAEDWDVDFFVVLVHEIWILEEDFCHFIYYCILYFRTQLLA